MTMQDVYFFDNRQQLIKIVAGEEIISCYQDKEITPEKGELLNDVLTVICGIDDDLDMAAFMGVQEENNEFSMYRIAKDNDKNNNLEFTGVGFASDELDNYIVKDIRPTGEPLEKVVTRILESTNGEWKVGYIEQGLPLITSSFYYISVKESLKQLQELGCEILFKCKVDGSGITDKWLEIYKEIGRDSNVRFEYGENALDIVHERDRTNIKTSIIGRGKGEEVGNGYGRRIEFSDVEWKKSDGKPLDKPKGQNWLENPEMTNLFGIPKRGGGMIKRESVQVFDNIEDPNELLEKTYESLMENSRPLVQFKTEVLEGDNIGNRVTIHRHDRGYHYKTRIFKTRLNRLTGALTCSLGDVLTTNMSRKGSAVANAVKVLDNNKTDFFEATEIGKYNDDVLRGAGPNGGSFYMMTRDETGKSAGREITESFWMNGSDISSSQNFLVMSSEGIAFKTCKKGQWSTPQEVHMAPSKNAWNINGEFNADFIKAGILSGILVQGNVVKTNDPKGAFQIVMDRGSLSFEKQKEATSVDSAHGKKYGSLDGIFKSGTNEVTGVSITQTPGYRFFIGSNYKDSSKISPVFEVPSDSTGERPKGKITASDIEINATNSTSINGRVNIRGSLFLNGQEVVPGAGSAPHPGPGDFPPEVVSQSDKWAWQVWSYLRANGYSKAAAAGVLGNIQGEVGSSMNPDTAQVGGPAYGWCQWDGSAYPLVGEPTRNGREYVQRLCQAAGITEDYRTPDAQLRLIIWCMVPGRQWIGRVDPKQVESFKALSNPRTAARAFERNFERPLVAHPERDDWAQQWYDKFLNLQPVAPIPPTTPGSPGQWGNPIRVPYYITQEWDQIGWGTSEIHGGIDIAPAGGVNCPVYSARNGRVISVIKLHPTGGNYVIVEHEESYWSYYGHLASINVVVGQQVTRDTVIGPCGATGLATGVHLHFEVWKGQQWKRINPRDVIEF